MTPRPAESVRDFIARALHDPERGYYARQIRTVGSRGDFSTTATLSRLLGSAIARWVRTEAKAQPTVRHIIEIGAGDGSLMAAVRTSLGWWQRRRFQFHIVDSSASLRTVQQRLLGPKLKWHADIESALQSARGSAIIYHNELLDAFPVNAIQWDPQSATWMEVWLDWSAPSAPREELRPLNFSEQDACAFSVLTQWTEKTPPPSDRQRCELGADTRIWLQNWAPLWKCGAMLSIDYGDVFPALYHRRPRGTLRSYLLHQRQEGLAVYANAGRQDITADVNFTDYRGWARALGWKELAFGTQAEFLSPAKEGNHRLTSADTFVSEASGAGGAFKYLVHRPA